MTRKNLQSHISYDPSLNEKAREMRNNSTPAEKLFWKSLRNMPFFKEAAFNRQKPVGKYIVDFYCHEHRLIVEIDGDTHAEESAIKYDKKRTQFLESQGLRVVRFTNREVLNNMDGVMTIIEKKIKEEAP